MRLSIDNPIVRKNIELFLELMRRVESSEKQKNEHAQFAAYIHRTTGQLFFDGLRKGHSISLDKEWKQIDLSYRFDPLTNTLQFEITGAEEERAFAYGELEPIAQKVVQQTMGLLQKMGDQLAGPSTLSTKISVMTRHTTIEPTASEKDKNIIVSTWRQCDRMCAENCLLNKPTGTFFFRKDFYTDILEKHLSLALKKEVKCVTLTFVAAEQKISDYTFVHVDHRWQHYNDDPTLEGKSFPDLLDLIDQFKEKLKFPLYHEE